MEISGDCVRILRSITGLCRADGDGELAEPEEVFPAESIWAIAKGTSSSMMKLVLVWGLYLHRRGGRGRCYVEKRRGIERLREMIKMTTRKDNQVSEGSGSAGGRC